MKKIILSLLLLVAFTFCKKTKSPEPAPIELPDKIEYKNIEPDISLTSSNGTTGKYMNGSGNHDIVLPVDTNAGYSLTSDQFADFQFELSVSNYHDTSTFYTPSGSHYSFVQRLFFSCLASGDSVLKPNKVLPRISLFSEGSFVGPGLPCNTYAYVHSSGGPYSDILNTDFTKGEHYFGFKKHRDGNNYYGWIKVESFGPNGIIVKEIAINKTPNKSILCGQKN